MSAFDELYDKVFDEEGNVRACGRALCRSLILEANKIGYGNVDTGFMNVEALKGLRRDMHGE